MRILKLTEDTRKDILQNLLKRSPNNYGEFEGRVNALLKKCEITAIRQFLIIPSSLTARTSMPVIFLLTEEEIAEAYEQVDTTLLAVIRKSLVNIKKYHENRCRIPGFTTEDGIILGQKVTALATVGVYVPGGKGRVSFFRTDECSSGKSCGSRPYCNVYATRQRWKSISFHSGCSQRSRS